MFNLTEIPSNFGSEKAVVKLSLQDVSTCSPNWIYVINTENNTETAIKCEVDADYSVSDDICSWRCPCDGNCTLALVQTPNTVAWNLCELRVF